MESSNLKIADLVFPSIQDCLQERKTEVLAFCRQLLPEKWLRGDYKELIQVVILYLDGNNLVDEDDVVFQRPGALHKARWMSKLLYSFKIVLLNRKIMSEFPKGSVFGSNQPPKMERFVTFVTFVYIPWWLTCPLAADAPTIDLLLLRRLHEFVEVDAVAPHAAIKAFNRHTWYLTEEVVPLCLFSEDVTDDVKAEIAGKLLKLPQSNPLNWHGAGFGKPALPVIEENVREIHSFFGPDSWKFFNLLKLDSTFLSASPTEWDRNESFLSSKSDKTPVNC